MIAALLCDRFGIDGELRAAALRAEQRVSAVEYPAQAEAAANVLAAFLAEGVVESDLAGGYGYGYSDAARERYESLLARIFGCEGVLARFAFASGTHAIVAAIEACVPAGKTLLSITGRPYDTLRHAITQARDSLAQRGLGYRETPFVEGFDLEAIDRELERDDVCAVFVQRSRGYAPRRSAGIAACEPVFRRIKAVRPDVAIVVDNCYGELVEAREPTHIGADLVAGSLIKNLGGSLAPAGGYVAGREHLVQRVATRLYAPGLRDQLGPTLGFGRALLQGLFLAPLVIEQTLRGLNFTSALFAELGYFVDPQPAQARTDIVQAIRLGDVNALQRFSAGLQSAMPVNARFVPEPGSVPGYAEPVLMSSGAFIAGSTIELSCDAPLRDPFDVYVQGGATLAHAMLGALLAARATGGPAAPERRA